MRKLITNKAIALLLAIVMIVSLLPTAVFAVEAVEFTVVVSMEGLTLGQGLYVEPTAYTLDEINTLIAEEGYGPYTEDDLPASMATLAMMLDKGLEYQNTGSWDSGMYLSAVKDIDKGTVNIPAVITENGGPSNDENDGNSDEWLGEFDYGWMAGWMITVNDFMIDVGCSDWIFTEGVSSGKCQDYGNIYVVRWQFTVDGYGADLGHNTGWGNEPYFDHVNKDMMYAAYALSDDAVAKASVMSTMENLTASAPEVAAAEAALTPQSGSDPAQDVSAVLSDTMTQLAATVTAPAFGTTAGEWTVLSLARGGYYAKDNAYFTEYYDRIVETVNTTAASVTLANGALHKNKSTDNSRLILALSSIGKDATSVGNWNLITPFEDFTWIKKQGINGPIFALIALDTNDYQIADTTIRQQCIDFILGKQLDDGGWALSGTASDPDITAMALQALANYKNQSAVATAAEEAFAWLSSAQNDKGGYSSWGTENSESIAQVIVACTAWGINPDTDSRFVKANGSAVDAILAFYDADAKGFKHTADGSVDAMATDQACYALVAYDRFVNGQTSLYDMSDVEFSTGPQLTGMQFYAGDLDAGLTPDFNADTLTGYSVTLKPSKSSMSIKVTAPDGCTVKVKHQGYNDATNALETLEYALSTTGWSTLKGFASTDGEILYGNIPVEIIVTDGDNNSTTYELTVVHKDPNAIEAVLGVPEKVNVGQAFNATVSLTNWKTDAGYKLIDFVMPIPQGLTVTGVTASDRLSGGTVSYHVEEATGKLRVVYFDANENMDLAVSGTEFPAELFVIGLKANGSVSGAPVEVAVTGMSLKLSSDSADDASMIVVNTDAASGTVEILASGVISYSAVTLYTGDDVDIIPSIKKAVAVAVTGIAAESTLQYNDGTHEIEFLYSADISAKTGVSSYVALVDASIEMANFINEENYSVSATTADMLTFGDANGDGIVNAQDALAAVDCWLRKGEEPTDLEILTLNVNGDSRINTFDALGIVEAFVNGTEYAVITKAATLATAN